MMLHGKAKACGAGTIINAISTWKGAAFAINIHTTAEVTLSKNTTAIKGIIQGGGDTRLIELTVKKTLEHFNLDHGGIVETKSEIPQASGLKSSSAAANATVLATLSAIKKTLPPETAINIGVNAALEAGVTITGAYDDATASYHGGITVTDNKNRQILRHEHLETDVVIYTPPTKAYSKDTNLTRSKLIAPWIYDANQQAEKGEYWHAMTLNGLLYSSALGFNPEPILEALEAGATAASLSGTGPSYVAITKNNKTTEKIAKVWSKLDGKVIKTKINNKGAHIIEG